MRGLMILGATGSVGRATLDVYALNREHFSLVGLTGHRDWRAMAELALRYRPACVVMSDTDAARRLEQELSGGAPRIFGGSEALEEVAALPEVDLVMAAIVGAAGLAPTLAAARAGKTVLLANKEALVMSGALFMETVLRHGATLLPIDSEQNAMFQCLPGYRCGEPVEAYGAEKILLTGSGGPFLRTPPEELTRVTPQQACEHPNWTMGRKISVDSATMMNKGLELIETAWLFHCELDRIEILIHPQSLVHSMIQFVDGSVMAQLGSPDMRIPIAYALGLPNRVPSGADPMNLLQSGSLQFEKPDFSRYPCLGLARQALVSGGRACAVLNAANETAVASFLSEAIGFVDISKVVAGVMDEMAVTGDCGSLEEVVALDGQARAQAAAFIRHLS